MQSGAQGQGSSTPSGKRYIEVAAGLVFHHGKLLLTQRRPQDHLGGLWEFPGGKREADETFEACLIRELREELGIEVRVGELIEEVRHDYPEKSVHLKFYRCDLIAGEPQPIWCQAVVWVNASQLRDYKFPAADAHLIEMLASTSAIWVS